MQMPIRRSGLLGLQFIYQAFNQCLEFVGTCLVLSIAASKWIDNVTGADADIPLQHKDLAFQSRLLCQDSITLPGSHRQYEVPWLQQKITHMTRPVFLKAKLVRSKHTHCSSRRFFTPCRGDSGRLHRNSQIGILGHLSEKCRGHRAAAGISRADKDNSVN
jgi:hypothetical protein